MQVGSSSAFLLKAGFLDELPHCWMLPEKIYFPIQDGCKIGICEPTLYINGEAASGSFVQAIDKRLRESKLSRKTRHDYMILKTELKRKWNEEMLEQPLLPKKEESLPLKFQVNLNQRQHSSQ